MPTILIEKDGHTRIAKTVTTQQRADAMKTARVWDLNADGTIAGGPYGPTEPIAAPIPAAGVTNQPDAGTALTPGDVLGLVEQWTPEQKAASGLQVDQTARDIALGRFLMPPTGLPETGLAQAVRDKLNAALVAPVAEGSLAQAVRDKLNAGSVTTATVAAAMSGMTFGQFGPYTRAVKLYEGIVMPAYEVMTFGGVTRAAKGDGISCRGTVNAGNGNLALDMHTVSADDIGKLVRHAAWDSNDYRVTDINVGTNELVVSPSLGGVTWQTMWWVGHDDTSRLQACLDAAAEMRRNSQTSNQDAGYGSIPRAGEVVLLHRANHGTFLSQAASIGGQKSALQIPRRVTFGARGGMDWGATLSVIPGSFGAVIAPKLYDGACDLVVVENLTISVNADPSSNPNTTYGIDWAVMDPGASVGGLGWAFVDPHSRFSNIHVRGAQKSARFSGAGALRLNNFNISEAIEGGLWMDGQNDWKLNGGELKGCGHWGMRVTGGGTHEAIGWKIYFCGKNGGASDENCCGLLLDGDNQGHGQGRFIGEIQETRGASVVIKSGNAKLDVLCLDPFRLDPDGKMGQDSVSNHTAGAAGDRPAVRTAVYFKGANARNNVVDLVASPSVQQWPGNQPATYPHNWASGVSLVHLDPYSAGAGGPQANSGIIRTRQTTVNGTGATELGTELTVGAATGATSNGKNQGLSVQGPTGLPVALT